MPPNDTPIYSLSEPRRPMMPPDTEAGKRLLERLGWFASEKGDALREGIRAIEAEAVANERQRIAAAVEGWFSQAQRDYFDPAAKSALTEAAAAVLRDVAGES